jgi:hypothetical protein
MNKLLDIVKVEQFSAPIKRRMEELPPMAMTNGLPNGEIDANKGIIEFDGKMYALITGYDKNRGIIFRSTTPFKAKIVALGNVEAARRVVLLP